MEVPEQAASETAVTVYVVVLAGVTFRVAGDVLTFGWVTPSDHVTLQGAVPVREADIVAGVPEQTVWLPETWAVGFEATVTAAEPELVPVQVASVTEVTV